jgi:thioredoxin-dependent peroxiredoxin
MRSTAGIEVGQIAPDFALPDRTGALWRLSDHRGKVVVLLFYPGDETPVCTKQMCSLRDRWEDYQKSGAEVVGISTDTVESHEQFAKNHNLPLNLLSDVNGEVTRTYRLKSWIPNRSARAVVVVGRDGVIIHKKVELLGIFRPSDDQILAAIRGQ